MRLTPRSPRETGRDYALHILRDNIVSLELAPGSQISENELAAELGLSRTPVREALIELSRVKIIETFPQKKSVVALIDYDMVEEARFMRNVLENAVVGLACEMARPEDIFQLRENVRLQRFYLENFNPDKIMELDDEFHRILFTIARKPQVFEQMSGLSIHFDRVRSMALTSVKDLKIIQDHEEIAEAVANKDAPRARELMEKHLNRSKVDAGEIREKNPQFIKTRQ